MSISDAADFVTGVMVRYRWTDAYDLAQEAFDYAGTPGLVAVIDHERAYPGPGAASAILARRTGRGRVLDLAATSDYAAEPTKPLVATLPDTPIQTGFISGVSWKFPEGEMRVNTRGLVDTPPTAWSLATEGLRWSDVPAGVHWSTYTPL